jgi:hypothetical protein
VREIEQAITRRLAFRSATRAFAALYGVAALAELLYLLFLLPEHESAGSPARFIPFLLPLGIAGVALVGSAMTTQDGEMWKVAAVGVVVFHVPYTLVILGGYSSLGPWIPLPLAVVYAGAYAPIAGMLAMVIAAIVAATTPSGVKPEPGSVLPAAARRRAAFAAFAVFLSAWLPALGCAAGARAKGRAALCETHLKRICERLDEYARDHEGRLPPSLADPELGLNEKLLHCPEGDGESARYAYIVEHLNASRSDAARRHSVSDLERAKRRPPWVWERRAWHINDGRNGRLGGKPPGHRCGFGSGATGILTGEELDEILKQAAARAGGGGPE